MVDQIKHSANFFARPSWNEVLQMNMNEALLSIISVFLVVVFLAQFVVFQEEIYFSPVFS
jgi:hypothetical protein